MEMYNQEKVLYLIDKKGRDGGMPFHVKAKELSQGRTTLAEMMPGMLKDKTVTTVSKEQMPNNGKDRSGNKLVGYLITEKGRMRLAGLQAQSRYHMDKSLDSVGMAMIPLIEKTLGRDDAAHFFSALTADQGTRFQKGGEDDKAVRLMNWLQMTQSHRGETLEGGDVERYYTVLPFARELGKAIAEARERGREVAPAVTPLPDAATNADAGTSVKATPPDTLLEMKAVAQFANDMVVEVDIDTPSPLAEELLAAQLIEEHLRDDAAIYYRPTEAGVAAIQKHRGALSAPDRMTLNDYVMVGESVLPHINPVHWDDAFDRQVPLLDAIEEAMDVKPQQDIRPTVDSLNDAVQQAAKLFPNPPSSSQLKTVTTALMENKGDTFEPALLDQAVSGYVMEQAQEKRPAMGKTL